MDIWETKCTGSSNQCYWFPYPNTAPLTSTVTLNSTYADYILPKYLKEPNETALEQGRFYYPINIFWNKYLGKCVSDCAADGTHHINP